MRARPIATWIFFGAVWATMAGLIAQSWIGAVLGFLFMVIGTAISVHFLRRRPAKQSTNSPPRNVPRKVQRDLE